MPLISVPLPTIDGREDYLAQACEAYEAYADVELLIVRNAASCGIAWQQAVEHATGDYIHFGADDVEMHPGWAEAAIATIDAGFIPAPRILNTDGSLQSCGNWGVEMEDGEVPEFTRGPMVSRSQWEKIGPMIPTCYYTDNWVTFRGRQFGIETVVCRGYEYTHHMASPGRNEGRMGVDGMLYQQYCERALRGQYP